MIPSRALWILGIAFVLLHVQFNLNSNLYFVAASLVCGLVPLNKMSWINYFIIELLVVAVAMALSFPESGHTDMLAGILHMPFWLYSIIVAILSATLFACLAYSVYRWITIPFIFDFYGIEIVTLRKDEA